MKNDNYVITIAPEYIKEIKRLDALTKSDWVIYKWECAGWDKTDNIPLYNRYKYNSPSEGYQAGLEFDLWIEHAGHVSKNRKEAEMDEMFSSMDARRVAQITNAH